MVTLARTQAHILCRIQDLVPPGAPEPSEPALLAELSELTSALIDTYGRAELRARDPFEPTRQRRLTVHCEAVQGALRDRRILLTGGAGLVGSHLAAALSNLQVRSIVAIDNLPGWTSAPPMVPLSGDVPFQRLSIDIRDRPALEALFASERPDVVFHLASQRLPGLAEIEVRATVTSNIRGTRNVIELCEASGVERCVFSSTGKASRYFTPDVYAGTKKINEWQFAARAACGGPAYGVVRFTHIIENSPVCADIDAKVRRGIVSHHAPHRYMQVQNVGEAVNLLLNATAFCQRGRLRLLAIQDLGWPVDVLELALHHIVRSGNDVPIYFSGLPPGYEEHTFQGQFDARRAGEFSALLNALETRDAELDATGEMVLAELSLPDPGAFDAGLRQLITTALDDRVPEAHIKLECADLVRRTSAALFAHADPALVLDILKWGVDPVALQREEATLDSFRDVIALLVGALYGRLTPDAMQRADPKPASLTQLADMLQRLPGLEREVAYLREVAPLSQSEPPPGFFANGARLGTVPTHPPSTNGHLNGHVQTLLTPGVSRTQHGLDGRQGRVRVGAPPAPRVSIVLPTLNERDNIGSLIDAIQTEVCDAEIVVVDDDSADGTWRVVEEIAAARPSVRLIRRTERGLTGAIQRGLSETHGDLVAWMDCDLSMPASTLPLLLREVEAGADLAIGSRYVPGGRDVRHPMLVASSVTINAMGWLLLGRRVRDYTTGFVAARRSVLEQLDLRGTHGEYCIDLLARAARRGMRISEVGYCLTPREGGCSKTAPSLRGFARNGWNYLRTIARLARDRET